jgi:hypothetical protein
MPNFKTEVLKTRMLADAKQTTIKITNDKGEFEIDDIKGIIETFEKTAKSKNNNIKTMVRINSYYTWATNSQKYFRRMETRRLRRVLGWKSCRDW